MDAGLQQHDNGWEGVTVSSPYLSSYAVCNSHVKVSLNDHGTCAKDAIQEWVATFKILSDFFQWDMSAKV